MIFLVNIMFIPNFPAIIVPDNSARIQCLLLMGVCVCVCVTEINALVHFVM